MKFRLVRYFTLASLLAFVAVVAVLGYVQRSIAIDNMITMEESTNVELAITFSNSLWDEFLPFVRKAGDLNKDELQSAPEQTVLLKEVLGMMRGLAVVKVKVFDLDGLTVFSTQASQIGDDKSNNAGYLSAVKGITASELTHRDTFSAFESVIEDRDVLSSYVPIYSPRTKQIEGVFEVYRDVTPFLAEIKAMTWTVLGVVLGSLALLYTVLFLIVKRADSIIKQQAEENTRAQLQVTQAEKMASLGQMVAGVAHELNTPLAFTRSNISMLKDFMDELRLPLNCGNRLIQQIRGNSGDLVNLRIKLNERVRERLTGVDDELSTEQLQQMLTDTMNGLEQMSELVVNLREFTRLDRAKIADFDINKGINNVIYIARSSMSEKVTVETELSDIETIRCMPSQMNQILINLINNAAQSIGDDTGTVTVRTASLDGHVRIEVEDDGCGIAEEAKERIFEPFYTTKDGDKGTGLGLSIVRDIILEHGGQIFVESTLGKGSKFTVLLPVEQALEQPMAA